MDLSKPNLNSERQIANKGNIPDPFFGGFFPSKKDELVLKAALKKDDSAIVSWEKWIEDSNIFHQEESSNWLFPLLHSNLKPFNITEPESKIFKGSYKLHWYQNLMRFKKLENIISYFDDMNVEYLLIKGAALLIEYYEDIGLRTMNDIDILVPPNQAAQAHSLLLQAGGTPEIFVDFPKLSRYRHSVGFHMKNNLTIDLHWNSFNNEGIGEKLEYWNFTKSASINPINPIATKVLVPEYNLFLTLVHSLTSGGPVASLRWIPDSVFILRKTSNEFNWITFLEITENYGLAIMAKHSLNYLQSTFEINIPAFVIQEIEKIPVTSRDKKYFSVRAKPSSWQKTIKLHYDNFRLRTAGKTLPQRIFQVIPYFSVRWNVNSLLKFPSELIKRIKMF